MNRKKHLHATFLPGILLGILICAPAWSQTDEIDTCLECHGEEEFTIDVDGREVSLFVDKGNYLSSVHGDFSCVDCHDDIEDIPHEDQLKRVECEMCHDEMFEAYSKSVHGSAALEAHDLLAPTCASCHGSHSIRPSSDTSSKTYIMNIPGTCGRCHKEGTEMTASHEIDQKNVVGNYSMSIHGEGLFKRGLIVTAVCTSCHGSHDILPHQNPDSKINKENVSNTCVQCHGQIEEVHQKIVEGKLWEEEPGKIPICVDCHAPHEIRRVFYNIEIADGTCLSCHSDPELKTERDGETLSLYVDAAKHRGSVHGQTTCVQCHFDVHPDQEPVCKDIEPVDCAVCHAEEMADHTQGIHGQLLAKGDTNAPDCVYCHGTHEILDRDDRESPTFPQNIPTLCSRCHNDGTEVSLRGHASQDGIISNYTMSIHGKGLMESGLMVTAVCTNCHTTHKELPASDPESSVNHDNIGKTCGTCHLGIYEKFRHSIHSTEVTETDEPLPSCSDCHESHTIMRVDKGDFRTLILSQCGRCHEELTETYFKTFHGKVSILGEETTAKCYDCHGSHEIFPVADIRSTLSRENIVGTCKKCHPGSHRKFTGYLTHATHHDKDRYPALYYSFLAMSCLLIGTLTFFGIHTLLWLFRALLVRSKLGCEADVSQIPREYEGRYIRRFRSSQRLVHLFVIVSFMSLAITGMIIKFPDVPFFGFIAGLLGGPGVCGTIHRMGAIVTFGYFGAHLIMVLRMFKKREITLKGLFSEEYTMLPTLRDLKELKQNMLWFIGRAEQPQFGRWTYWEKFDYFAVFWGVAIIGISGLVLWFPEKATYIVPGWMINVATVIHSDEALLAAGFIFTVHFFNTHFRPCVFPIDPVIFTGRVPLAEFKAQRPREYEQLVESGELERYLVGPPRKWFLKWAKVIGLTFLTIGLILVGTIIYGMLVAYH